jgi:hypothetical protein
MIFLIFLGLVIVAAVIAYGITWLITKALKLPLFLSKDSKGKRRWMKEARTSYFIWLFFYFAVALGAYVEIAPLLPK